jgi:hypothetical protein
MTDLTPDDIAFLAAHGVEEDDLHRAFNMGDALAAALREWHYEGCAINPCSCERPEVDAWEAFKRGERP